MLDSWKKRAKLREELLKGKVTEVTDRPFLILRKGQVETCWEGGGREQENEFNTQFPGTWKKVKEAKTNVSLGRTPEYGNLEMDLSFNTV